ncbi:MAG: hypothetical protein HYX60_01100 [Legionella longbeachae]|nr:hypothetical protein [Legionella longbeachae]
MNIFTKFKGGFIEVYTHEDPPPSVELQSNKKPYIVFKCQRNEQSVNYLDDHCKQFKSLGNVVIQNNALSIKITSKRKVAEAIKLFRSDSNYKNEHNNELMEKFIKIESSLRQGNTINIPPVKSKDVEKYAFDSMQINNEVSAHTTGFIKNKTKDQRVLFKEALYGRRIAEIEVFNGLCFRILLNKATPKVRGLHNKEGLHLGVISHEIPNFQSIYDYAEKYQKAPNKKALVEAHLGKVLAAAYCEEENDLHAGNIGFDSENLKTYKIDHDQATWPISYKYVSIYSNKKPAVDTFPITQYDINHFPQLKDASPRNFAHNDNQEALDITGIENDDLFIKDVFSIFLKRALLTESIYQKMAEATITNVKLQKQLVEHKTKRGQLLRAELIKNKKFCIFILNHPELKEEIITEFNSYNNDYKENSPLRINVDELADQYDQLTKECERTVPIKAFNKALELFKNNLHQLNSNDNNCKLYEKGNQLLQQVQQLVDDDINSLPLMITVLESTNAYLQGDITAEDYHKQADTVQKMQTPVLSFIGNLMKTIGSMVALLGVVLSFTPVGLFPGVITTGSGIALAGLGMFCNRKMGASKVMNELANEKEIVALKS